jgi:hypothetical protein
LKKNDIEQFYNDCVFYSELFKGVKAVHSRMNALHLILLIVLIPFSALLVPLAFITDKAKDRSYRNLVISFGHLQKKLANIISVEGLNHIHCRPKRDLFSLMLPYAIIGATRVLVIISIRHDLRKIKNMTLRYFGDLVMFIIYRQLLHKELRVFIHFNDHYPLNLLLQREAQTFGIKTVYIQHAAVTKEFPELTADINLLFSQDSNEKYRNTQKKEVIVLSDLRFVNMKKIELNTMTNRQTVMIVFNKRDDISTVARLASSLATIMRINIIVRPHPDDARKGLIRLNHLSQRVSLSYAELEDDLANCDVVLLNETNVILECIFYRKAFILTTFLGPFNDHYGYYKSGLVLNRADSSNELLKILSSNEEISVLNKESLSWYMGSLEAGANYWLKTIKDLCAE